MFYHRNSSTPFTYNVTFSNTTAIVTLALNTNKANLVLEFAGQRVSYFQSSNSSTYRLGDPSNVSGMDGNVTVGLNTSDPNFPRFTWVNGSNIVFSKSSGRWEATSGTIGNLQRLNVLNLLILPGTIFWLF
jgi:hypothetical protein